jgi:D-aminoacyl-tRNA deacylase
MRALLQRSRHSRVLVEGRVQGEIPRGLVVFLGVGRGDTRADLEYLAEKIINLRIFEDEAGKMNLDIRQAGGEVLVVSQFTLYGDCRKGRRPGFTAAAAPEEAERLYEEFCRFLEQAGLKVATGEFGASMQVEITNDGPVTLMLESPGPA